MRKRARAVMFSEEGIEVLGDFASRLRSLEPADYDFKIPDVSKAKSRRRCKDYVHARCSSVIVSLN